MSLEKENQAIPPPGSQNKLKKFSYSREFLLSLSELDVCKKLPSGFEISSELWDALFERKTLGSTGYSRVSQGRWDVRSSGSSDKEGDLKSDREPLVPDAGRRFGNKTRRFSPNTEQDGLLGRGLFPRPPGYSGIRAEKPPGNVPYQLKKSTEPYQPPRPYKAAPHSRKDFTDSCNDETFGSSDFSNEDRAEEERKRRASFELMRKEQHKTLQEKQKPNPEKIKDDVDIFAMLGNSADGKSMRSDNKSDEPVGPSLSHNDSSKTSLYIQAAARPLVPPGFASTSLEKNHSIPTSVISQNMEVGNALVDNDRSLDYLDNDQDKHLSAAHMQFDMELNEVKGISSLFVGANEKLLAPPSSSNVLEQALNSGKKSGMSASIQEATHLWKDDIANDHAHQNDALSEITNTASQDHSTTILEKLFSSALSKDYGNSPNAIEHQEGRLEEEGTWSPALLESSKFAHWFSEDKRKPIEDFSSRNLLSLISNEKVIPHISTSPNVRVVEPTPPGFPMETPPNFHPLPLTSAPVQKPEDYSRLNNKAPSSAILTCEDLEQLILAEATGSSPKAPQTTAVHTPFDGNLKEQKVAVNDHASHHLFTLLQKGTSLKELSESSDKKDTNDLDDSSHLQISDSTAVKNPEKAHSSEQNITLETFFGSAFMNELHSADAPVSANRGSAGTINKAPHGDDGFFSSIIAESRSNKIVREGDRLAFNNTAPLPGSYIERSFEHGEAVDIRLPEEDSLISVSDMPKHIASEPFPFENVHKPDEFKDSFFGAILRDGERLNTRVPEAPPPLHNSLFEMVDPNGSYNHLHGRPSPQYPHPMNQARPSFQPFDHLAQRNVNMNFSGRDGLHHDAHHLPETVIPRHALSNVVNPRLDPAVAHHLMLQQMSVQGNFPHQHTMQRFPSGIPPTHSYNQMPGYMPEMNNMHNFGMQHRQPSYGGGLGMGLPGSNPQGSGGHHPEALERLIEMEMRANSNHGHPAVGPQIPGIPGIYSPELDMNFR